MSKVLLRYQPSGRTVRWKERTRHLHKLSPTSPKLTASELVAIADFRGLTEAGFSPVAALLATSKTGEALDLTKDAKSTHEAKPKKRRVGRGLTSRGRNRIQDALAVVERKTPRGTLTFGTLTLPDSVLALSLKDQESYRAKLSVALTSFLKSLAQYLRRAGLPGEVTTVCEAHPQRSQKLGFAAPHWHWVAQGRHRGKTWTVKTDWVTMTWHKALIKAGLVQPTAPAPVTNVQGVKKSVRRYMSKYLSKSYRNHGVGQEDHYWRAMPPQCYSISNRLLKELARLTIVIHGDSARIMWAAIKRLPQHLHSGIREQFVKFADGLEHWVADVVYLSDQAMRKLGVLV